MAKHPNVAVVEKLYAAFGKGDLDGLLAGLADDVEWRHPRPADIPWGGRRRGKKEVAGFFAALGAAVEPVAFEPQEFLAQGDQVVVLGKERMRVKLTGRDYETDWVHVFTLRGGKVVSFKEYSDTAAIVEALRPVK